MHYLRFWKHGDPTFVHFDRTPQGEVCAADDCESPPWARGLCGMHYRRVQRTGRLEGRTALDRFMEKVIKEGGCWLWQAERDGDGYGYYWAEQRRWRAHRWAYATLVGPIPEGLELDHLCHVRNCVNPAHLEPVTQAENHRRWRARAKQRKAG